MEPLSTIKSIQEAIKQDPSLRVSLAKKYQELGGTLVNGSIPLPYKEEIPSGYTKTSSGVYQPTVITSANINEKVIPDLKEKAKNLTQTGSFVDSQGVERTADQVPVPQKDEDAEFLKNLADFNRKFGRQANDTTGIKKVAGGGIDTSKAFDEEGNVIGGTKTPTKQESELDETYKQSQDLINQMKTSLDASTKRQIDNIEALFNIRRQQMEEIGRRQEKGIAQTLLMGGSSRYAQLSSAGVIAAKERDSLLKIAELDAQEKEQINAVMTAQETGDFRLLEKKINLLEEKRKEKQKEAETLSKAIAEENKRLREEKEKLDEADRIRSIGDFVSDSIASGTTDVNEIYRQARLSGIKGNAKEITDSINNLKIAEKIAPGSIGEWLALKENAPEMKDLTYEEFLNIKDPTRALDIKQQILQIKKLEKDLSDKGITEEPSNLLAYAQQYAATGQIPVGLPKGTFGIVSQTAKDLPKITGTIVNTITGIKDSKTSGAMQEDFVALYDITQKVKRLKELDKERMQGLISGTLGKIFGSDKQGEYLDLRKSIVDDIARMQTGAALTLAEQDFYEKYLPGRVGEVAWIFGRDTQEKINSFEKIMNERLQNRTVANGLSIYGYSKVKIGDKNYTAGDIITNEKGKQGRVNPDGTISIIE